MVQRLIGSAICFMVALGAAPAAQSKSVVQTRLLDWSAEALLPGMERLRDEFLAASGRGDREHVGAVLRLPDGRYRFTQGVGRRGQDTVRFGFERPQRATLVGFWHTHGEAGAARHLFSPTDAELVRQSGLPFYLITPDGGIRVLAPEHVDAHTRVMVAPGRSALRAPRGSHPGEALARAPHPDSLVQG